MYFESSFQHWKYKYSSSRTFRSDKPNVFTVWMRCHKSCDYQKSLAMFLNDSGLISSDVKLRATFIATSNVTLFCPHLLFFFKQKARLFFSTNLASVQEMLTTYMQRSVILWKFINSKSESKVLRLLFICRWKWRNLQQLGRILTLELWSVG